MINQFKSIMKNKNVIFLVVSLLLVISSCNKNEYTEFFKDPAPLGHLGYGYNNEGNSPDENFVITSNAEYLLFQNLCKEFYDSIWPDINFDNHTILAGFLTLSSGASIVQEPEFSEILEEDTYIYRPYILKGSYQALTPVTYWLVVGKLPKNVKVLFEPVINEMK